MKPQRYLQLDVFAALPGDGNPLGVVVDGRGFDTAGMQRFAAWTNLSETIFLLPPTVAAADYRVRIFTPRRELPFAGHPSVGAAWVALETGLIPSGKTAPTQECAAGLLPVRIEGLNEGLNERRVVRVRTPRARQVGDASLAPDLLRNVVRGMSCGRLSPALWNNGPNWWLLELADADAVRRLQPDLDAIAALTRATDAVGLAVHAPEDRDGHHLVVRAFCPADGIPEDPVTGSAQAAIAAQLAAAERLPGKDGSYVGSQGRELGRNGRVEVRIDADGEIWIGGQVQCVIDGELRW